MGLVLGGWVLLVIIGAVNIAVYIHKRMNKK